MKYCQDWWLKDVEASKQTHKCYKKIVNNWSNLSHYLNWFLSYLIY